MNTVEQSTSPPLDLSPGSSEEQTVKLRRRLEDVFQSVSLVHDVVTVCVELSQGSSGDFNSEIAHVLRFCAADRLRFQMTVLTSVIERLAERSVSKGEAATPGRAMA
jgi:hypothetical protein